MDERNQGGQTGPTSLESVGLLAEPIRRTLYEYVATRAEPVDRDAAAAAVGVGRPLAAFHLDRLAAGGLLDVEYHRRTGRTGPGAGRPAKFYRRSATGIDVSLPPRRDGLAAGIFAGALSGLADAAETVARAAEAEGRRIAEEARRDTGDTTRSGPGEALGRVLAGLGFEPERDERGTIQLRNCPFRALVPEHRALTCGANLAMLRGIVGALPETGLAARKNEAAGYCRVSLVPAK